MVAWKRTFGWAVGLGLAVAVGAVAEPEAEVVAPALVPEADAAVETDEAEASPDGMDSVDVSEIAAEGDLVEADGEMEASLPMAGSDPMPPAAMEPEAPAEPARRELGVVAYDSEGRQGRIHIVASGDTLWDVSDAYLGTPWVWPSIWKDNDAIANPHVIHPGDRIWITPTEMRRLTAEEADAMLANGPGFPAELDVPAALDTDTLDDAPLTAPEESLSIRIPNREMAGMITPEVLESAASVVSSVHERVLMSQEDEIYIGLGDSEVDVGDEFTLFRVNERVLDPDTGAQLGYHVDVLGWIRVEEAHEETSLASIRMSTSEVEVGDRLLPREPLPAEIPIGASPEGVEGKISFFPGRRVLMGHEDFVYLNRGTLDGLEVGSPLEVYRSAFPAREEARDERVEVADRLIGTMLVVRAEEESAVAVVTSTRRELKLGDRFRGAETH